jgi:hypothetical protein
MSWAGDAECSDNIVVFWASHCNSNHMETVQVFLTVEAVAPLTDCFQFVTQLFAFSNR